MSFLQMDLTKYILNDLRECVLEIVEIFKNEDAASSSEKGNKNL